MNQRRLGQPGRWIAAAIGVAGVMLAPLVIAPTVDMDAPEGLRA